MDLPSSAQAYWVTGPEQASIRDETIRPIAPGEVLVRSLCSGISRGTEMLVYRDRVPASEYQRMRAPFQSGEFPYPVKYGYASVGCVEQGPSELVGHTVFCLHPHQTFFVVPASAVHRIPAHVPPERAILAANMETAINGLWDAAPSIGDRVAVIGAGAVGCLLAYLVNRIPGVETQLVDINPRREAVAQSLGVSFAQPENAQTEADLVLHASGHQSGLALALRLAGFGASIIEMSWYGQQTVNIDLGAAFHSRRLAIKSSQVGTIAPGHSERWTYQRRLGLALSLLDDKRLDNLITGSSAFSALPQTMRQLADTPGDEICHRIDYA